MISNTTIPVATELLFEQPTLQLNFETLKESATDQLANGGMKPSRPVQHFQFIQWLQQEIGESAAIADPILEPITVSRSHSKRISFDGSPKDACPIDKFLIGRLVTRIGLDYEIEVAGEKLKPCFAISYNDDGIEVAFGSNVWSCANMNIFGSTVYRTYGHDKLAFEVFKDVILAQISTYKERHNINCDIIDKLSKVELDVTAQKLWEADIFEIAVKANKAKRKDLVLNLSQVTRMTEEILDKREHSDAFTAWTFNQAGTQNLKPDSQDLVSLYSTTEKFNSWVCDKAQVAHIGATQ